MMCLMRPVCGLVASALFIVAAPSANATLIGDTVTYENRFLGGVIGTDTTTVVEASTEFSQGIAGGTMDIDVEASSIRFFVQNGSSGSDVSFGADGFEQSFRVFDLDWVDIPGEILDITVTISGVSGLIADPVVFGADFVDLAVGGSSWTYNTDFVLVNLVTTHAAPEPTTLALLGLGLVGVGFSRRKKLH
jgi:hypothetical protein